MFTEITIKSTGGEIMPNAKVLLEKQQTVVELTARLQKSISGVFVDYKGVTVAQVTVLRNEFRKAGVEYSVVKNTMTSRAAKNAGLLGLDVILNGTTALATSENDLIAPARIVAEFIKKNKKLIIKAGFIEGKTIQATTVEELAVLPSKEVLVARVLGGFNTPISKFARVLQAIADKKEQESA